ncbi:PAS domain S-box protein [Geobacter sp. AOG2]|uniref:PAS domain-containing protein n=1 Tax=Geobacter sp. AOG2 TaxID=1566347 RepID=UPI001CC73B0D|nr:PAS domain S-box protein [Geobacter sp. AOG2]GFE62658.1 hypothetical protein AOG2_32460 [Geobacter sp. AOG2]
MEPSAFVITPQEYRILVERAPIMIWRAGTDGLCNYFNQRWLEFTGRNMAQEQGNGWAEGVHPEDLDRCLEIYLDNFGKRLAFEMEYRLKRHDGVYRWILDRGTPFYLDDGEFGGYIGSCIDTTERVEARAAIRQAQESRITRLEGLLPICANCKNIRDDEGYWHNVESYISAHSGADFSHGICPVCAEKLYGYKKQE